MGDPDTTDDRPISHRDYYYAVRHRARQETGLFIHAQIVGYVLLSVVAGVIGFWGGDDTAAKFIGAMAGVLFVGVASVLLAYLWNLGRAPTLIYRDQAQSVGALTKLQTSAEKRQVAARDKADARLLEDQVLTGLDDLGKSLAVTAAFLISEPEYDQWVKDVTAWQGGVENSVGLLHAALFTNTDDFVPPNIKWIGWKSDRDIDLAELNHHRRNLTEIIRQRASSR